MSGSQTAGFAAFATLVAACAEPPARSIDSANAAISTLATVLVASIDGSEIVRISGPEALPGSDNWRALMNADVSPAIDEAFGELVTVTPASVPKINFPSIPDPSKAVTVTAVFTSKAKP